MIEFGIGELYQRLGLDTMATHVPHVAQDAAREEPSFQGSTNDYFRLNTVSVKSAAVQSLPVRLASPQPSISTTSASRPARPNNCSTSSRASSNAPRTSSSLGPALAKTHLAVALDYNATQSGIKTRFVSAADLCSNSSPPIDRDGSVSTSAQASKWPKLLIIDEADICRSRARRPPTSSR